MGSELANIAIQVDTTVLAFLAGTVVPLLVALVTKLESSSRIKAVANLVLSMVTGGIAYLVAHEGDGNVLDLIAAMIAVYLASGVAHHNLWKPTGVTNATQRKTASVGVGNSSRETGAISTDKIHAGTVTVEKAKRHSSNPSNLDDPDNWTEK